MADLLRFQSRVPPCTFQATSSLKINIFARPGRARERLQRLSILPLLQGDVPALDRVISMRRQRLPLEGKGEERRRSNLRTRRDDDFGSSLSLSLSNVVCSGIRRGAVFRRSSRRAVGGWGLGEFVYSAQTNRPNASRPKGVLQSHGAALKIPFYKICYGIA